MDSYGAVTSGIDTQEGNQQPLSRLLVTYAVQVTAALVTTTHFFTNSTIKSEDDL